MLVHGDWFLVLDICSHGRAINAKGLPANNVDPFPVRVVPLTNENREPPSDPTWSLVRRGPGVRGSAPGSEEVKARDKGAADSPVCFPDPHTWREKKSRTIDKPPAVSRTRTRIFIPLSVSPNANTSEIRITTPSFLHHDPRCWEGSWSDR
jgi:hypothetical protein